MHNSRHTQQEDVEWAGVHVVVVDEVPCTGVAPKRYSMLQAGIAKRHTDPRGSSHSRITQAFGNARLSCMIQIADCCHTICIAGGRRGYEWWKQQKCNSPG